jgi:glutaredoxin
MNETAVIYSNESQECNRMASLLKNLGGEFLEYRLGTHFTKDAFYGEFGEEATFPQITVGYKHIGSMHDTLKWMKHRGLFA